MPFYQTPKETSEQKRRRLHLIATVGGSLAPKGTYGLPSQEQMRRSDAERKRSSRRARFAWALYWIAFIALFTAGIAGLAAGIAWLLVVAVGAVLLLIVGGTALGVRSELRASRNRSERRSQ